jgi:hypothetical protein
MVFYFFAFAAWWTLTVPTSLTIYLWANDLSEVRSTTGSFPGDAFGVFVVVTMLAFLANYLGMWTYLFSCDNSGRRIKVWWAFWFFLTAPVATIPYFFLVYRSQYSASTRTPSHEVVS